MLDRIDIARGEGQREGREWGERDGYREGRRAGLELGLAIGGFVLTVASVIVGRRG